ARAARERLGDGARLEPGPAREHRRGAARRAARRLSRQSPAAGTACRHRDGGAGEPRPRRERGAQGQGDTHTRYERRRLDGVGVLQSRRTRGGPARAEAGVASDAYRWVILAAGTLAQASFSTASVGLPALAPAIRAHYRLSLSETGVVLAAIGIGMLFTLLPWGFAADRFDEPAVIATGLVGAGVAFALAAE